MVNLAAKLDIEISKICPIYGVSVGKQNDKLTWEINFKPEATQLQEDAARLFVDNFDVDQFVVEEAAKEAASISGIDMRRKAIDKALAYIASKPDAPQEVKDYVK